MQTLSPLPSFFVLRCGSTSFLQSNFSRSELVWWHCDLFEFVAVLFDCLSMPMLCWPFVKPSCPSDCAPDCTKHASYAPWHPTMSSLLDGPLAWPRTVVLRLGVSTRKESNDEVEVWWWETPSKMMASSCCELWWKMQVQQGYFLLLPVPAVVRGQLQPPPAPAALPLLENDSPPPDIPEPSVPPPPPRPPHSRSLSVDLKSRTDSGGFLVFVQIVFQNFSFPYK